MGILQTKQYVDYVQVQSRPQQYSYTTLKLTRPYTSTTGFFLPSVVFSFCSGIVTEREASRVVEMCTVYSIVTDSHSQSLVKSSSIQHLAALLHVDLDAGESHWCVFANTNAMQVVFFFQFQIFVHCPICNAMQQTPWVSFS